MSKSRYCLCIFHKPIASICNTSFTAKIRLGYSNDKSLKTYFGLLTVQSTVPAIQHIVCQNNTIYLPV